MSENRRLQQNKLSDLDIETLPNGFSIIFDDDKPIGAIINYKYYKYISWLFSKVKEYVKTSQLGNSSDG